MSYCGVVLLPEDILTEIFIRLPVKSIGKSRCVSKRWNSLLTSPRFIKTHLARSDQKKLLLLPKDPSLFTFTLRPDGVAEGTFKKRVSIPPLDEYSTLVGHCNGLVLIAMGERCHLLMNPATLEHSRLPQSPNFALGPSEIRIGHEYGFGYDSASDDYKVVNFFVVCDIAENRLLERLLDPPFCQIFADIYSVKKRCWRRVDLDWPPSLIAGGTNGGAGVFVNGALHWLSIYPNDVICAIDLGSEKCYEIPSLLRGKHNYVDRLIVSKGSCLGIVCWDKDEARIDIWTMNRYGMAESWTKNVYVVVGSQDIIGKRPWCWRDALVILYPDKLTFYSFNDEKSFSMTLDTTTINNPLEGGQRVDGLMFSETLVSPHHFDTTHTQQYEDEDEDEDEDEQCPS